MKKKVLIFSILVSIVLLGGFISLFKITDVSFQKKNTECINEDLASQTDFKGKNILFFDASKTLNNLKAKYICIKDISIMKKYPHSLVVTIDGRKPSLSFSAPISTASSTEYFISDETGFLFESSESSPSGIPYIEYLQESKLKVGMNLGFLAINTQTVVSKLSEFKIPIKDLIIEEDYLEVKSDNPASLVFSLKNDIAKELASLQLILQAGKMNSEPVTMERVDLRFQKPIVNYSPKK